MSRVSPAPAQRQALARAALDGRWGAPEIAERTELRNVCVKL